MTIRKYLCLSTTHLQRTTLEPAPHPNHLLAHYPDGAFYSVPAGDAHPDTPFDLELVLTIAKGMECTGVRFDRSADRNEFLPVFVW